MLLYFYKHWNATSVYLLLQAQQTEPQGLFNAKLLIKRVTQFGTRRQHFWDLIHKDMGQLIDMHCTEFLQWNFLIFFYTQ
jgi:hypothetical protein